MCVALAAPLAIPGPRPLPLLGVSRDLPALAADSARCLQRLHARYGAIARLAAGSRSYVFVFTPDYARQVLEDPERFQNLDARSSPLRMGPRSALRRLYAGLTNMNGPGHHQHRRLMAPALHPQRIDGYRDDVVALAERRLARWRVGETRDVFDEMRALTLEVAVKTLLGLEPERDGRTMARLLGDWLGLVFAARALLLPFDVPGLPYHRLIALSERLAAELTAMIARRRASAEEREDVLAALLRARDADGAALGDDELLGQVSFLFMAGHVTTASALTWTLFLLSQHPSVLGDLLDELQGALGGAPPRLDQLARLPLLDAVLKESLRLFPPVIWWSRVSAEESALGPYPIAAGTYVAYSAFVIHRLSTLYPAPSAFLPARWERADPGPYDYLPFSAGPRVCLGSAFATLEMKLILAVLLQRVGLGLAPRARVDHGGMVLSQPRHGMPMRVTRPGDAPITPVRAGNIRALVDLPE